jgi:hypothetical protein
VTPPSEESLASALAGVVQRVDRRTPQQDELHAVGEALSDLLYGYGYDGVDERMTSDN